MGFARTGHTSHDSCSHTRNAINRAQQPEGIKVGAQRVEGYAIVRFPPVALPWAARLDDLLQTATWVQQRKTVKEVAGTDNYEGRGRRRMRGI